MSKQSILKTNQGYELKPVFAICSNCKHFKSDKIINEWNYEDEKNIRCELGGFAVKKTATCKMHQFNLK